MANRANLTGIKEALQTLFDSANTTTASPIDLSNGLSNSKRVRKVLKVNPEMIIPQSSFFPLVTCYVDNKSVVGQDIAKDQLSAFRNAVVDVKIVGSVWNTNLLSVDEDPADEDINNLMENIELILRSDSTLNGTVIWQKTSECKYYTTILNEQNHLRTGILTLECKVYY